MTLTHIDAAYCPACGQERLHRMEMTGHLKCMNDKCPNPIAAQHVLSDKEIHHIVRFKDYAFNVKHPLRERIDGELLDCPIHAVVTAWLSGKSGPDYKDSTWRCKYEPTWTDNPEFGGDPFSWEKL